MRRRRPPAQSKRDRLCAFSDGVIAIAITLLVLALEVPSVHEVPEQQLDRGPLCPHARRSLELADGANTFGCSTTGSSEAAMLGGMAMKRAWEAKRKAAGKLT